MDGPLAHFGTTVTTSVIQIVLPGTDLRTSRLGFGTASLHHLVLPHERRAILSTALDTGITHFDTARMYGDGMAERELGRFIAGFRSEVTIGTKFGMPARASLERFPALVYGHRAVRTLVRRVASFNQRPPPLMLSERDAEDSLARSLRALRTDWIDILFVHEPRSSDLQHVISLADWLDRTRASGRVRYLGLAGAAEACVAIANQASGLFDVLQVEDSLDGKEADVITKSGREIQLTFGYLRNARRRFASSPQTRALRAGLARNPKGTVLVSSRYRDHLRELAKVAGGALKDETP